MWKAFSTCHTIELSGGASSPNTDIIIAYVEEMVGLNS
jgi:hypothetical protein